MKTPEDFKSFWSAHHKDIDWLGKSEHNDFANEKRSYVTVAFRDNNFCSLTDWSYFFVLNMKLWATKSLALPLRISEGFV